MTWLAQSDVQVALDLASRIGVIGLLILIVYGGWKQWWVFSWVYKDLVGRYELLRKERDEWKEIALRSANLAEILDEIRKYGVRQ